MWPDPIRTAPLIEPYEAGVRTDAPCGPGQPGIGDAIAGSGPRTVRGEDQCSSCIEDHSQGEDLGGALSPKDEEDRLDALAEANRDALCERDPDAGFYGRPWR